MSKEGLRESKAATEYRLSISSNPGSRRSSIGEVNDHPRSGSVENNNDELRGATVIDTYVLPQIQELTDSMITLDANFTHMNFIHESLVDFNESMSALLYGLMCNSWCVDFPNLPHDTAHELSIRKELQSLEKERQLLLAQLRGTTSRSLAVISETEPTLQKENTQLVKKSTAIPQYNTISIRSMVADAEDDEDNTAASFVSNPTLAVAPPVIPVQQDVVRSKRRYSILNQIRNNESTSQQNSKTSNRLSSLAMPSITVEKRKSLAVSASRIANKKQALVRPASNGKTSSVSKRVHNNSTGKSISRSDPPMAPPFTTQGRRPPFR
ncbi:HFR084Wp [Eremothecium sinecaudum]|uniref:DASH complex subunit DAM1 n=1 Tax=Eremothecium sinecaudum TaxID=45286 RepID=A0A0X8HV12_9SACH|nr:HFR084Wp [Eremothecium sinecaudum]AMD21939.1 HFR084Wp [Eremothecium sinecaudum]